MRLRRFIIALVASAVALVGLAVAANAQPKEGDYGPPDPQTTNIPYVAWAGESVRVAKCFGAGEGEKGDAQSALEGAGLDIHSITTRGLFNIEDWSGDPNQKPVFTNAPTGDVVPTLETSGHGDATITRLCYTVNMTSQKAGMAVVKLSVREDLLGLFPGLQVAAQHQFLVIWLKSQAPVITEVGDKEPGGWAVGDPAGDGVFQPPYEGGLTGVNGLVKVNVKGTFPLGQNFAGTVAGDTITLPDDWALLASKYAIDKSTNVPGAAAMRWDIHDDDALGHDLGPFHQRFEAGADDHHVNSGCANASNTSMDAVDNCLGILPWLTDDAAAQDTSLGQFFAELGPFSSINGLHPAIGPFDPLRPFTSVFSDGKLDAGDAPMPALQVNVALGDGSIGALGCSEDATGSGYCGPENAYADKGDIYIQDHTQPYWYPHNLYAPFYKQLIPPVGIAGWQDPHMALAFGEYYEGRSGVVGSFANNYPGFLYQGVYDNWQALAVSGRDGYNACNDPRGQAYAMPTGASKVMVYTDEHGEAYVKFYPYRGLYLSPDGNNRCDLSPGLYGSATIQAQSIYPDQPVLWDQSNKLSNVLDKSANHLASKVLKCIPKGTNEGFCVETILDFNGDPISGAPVKFTTSGDAANMDVDSVKFGGFDTSGQGVVVNPNSVGNDYAVLTTNKLGQAGVLVTHSQDVCIDITTENLGTRYTKDNPGVKRFSEFNPHTGQACGTATGGGPTTDPGTPEPPDANGGGSGNGGGSTGGAGGSTGGGGGSAVASSPSVVVSLGGPVIQAQPQLAAGSSNSVVLNTASAKLFSLKVMQTKTGRFLVLNVKGSTHLKKSKVLFLLKNKHGQLVKVWKTVPAAKVRMQILGKNGHVIRTVTRTVPVNTSFKITNLKLPTQTASVRATVIA